jgi:hypothetical protein
MLNRLRRLLGKNSEQQKEEPTDIGGIPVVEIHREYAPSKQSPDGRIFALGESRSGLGLQRLWGKLRACLTREFTVDFDMKNAHPTILLYLVRKHFPGGDDWQAPLASEWCMGRDGDEN